MFACRDTKDLQLFRLRLHHVYITVVTLFNKKFLCTTVLKTCCRCGVGDACAHQGPPRPISRIMEEKRRYGDKDE